MFGKGYAAVFAARAAMLFLFHTARSRNVFYQAEKTHNITILQAFQHTYFLGSALYEALLGNFRKTLIKAQRSFRRFEKCTSLSL